jgi:hypothetical protein
MRNETQVGKEARHKRWPVNAAWCAEQSSCPE